MPGFDSIEPEINSHGVKALGAIFKYVNFPISKQEIIQKYGDREIEYTSGETMKVKDIFTDYPKDKFDTLSDLEFAFHNKLSQG
jgi:hypothetical protein